VDSSFAIDEKKQRSMIHSPTKSNVIFAVCVGTTTELPRSAKVDGAFCDANIAMRTTEFGSGDDRGPSLQ
jgi:hypothetical protein